MLTGETEDTLKPGRRVDAVALRVFASEVVCSVRARARSPARRSRHLLRTAQARRPPRVASDLPAPDGGGSVVGAPCRTLRMHFASSCMPTHGTGLAPPFIFGMGAAGRTACGSQRALTLTAPAGAGAGGRARDDRGGGPVVQRRRRQRCARARAAGRHAGRAVRAPAPRARRSAPGSAASAHAVCAVNNLCKMACAYSW